LRSNYVLEGKITPSLRGHDYSIKKKGLSCSPKQLKLFLLEDMTILGGKKV